MSVFFLLLAYLLARADLLAVSEQPAVPAGKGRVRKEPRGSSRTSLPGRRLQSYQRDQGTRSKGHRSLPNSQLLTNRLGT